MEENTIKTKNGNTVYIDSTADLDDKERRVMDLINGAKPMNEEEEKIARQIKDIEARGGIVEIPFD